MSPCCTLHPQDLLISYNCKSVPFDHRHPFPPTHHPLPLASTNLFSEYSLFVCFNFTYNWDNALLSFFVWLSIMQSSSMLSQMQDRLLFEAERYSLYITNVFFTKAMPVPKDLPILIYYLFFLSENVQKQQQREWIFTFQKFTEPFEGKK